MCGQGGSATQTVEGSPIDRHASRLILTRHARCRMDCRHITEKEIREVLEEGEINYRKSEPDAHPDPKYALEGYTQSLRMELRSTGVKVVILNPGDFNTPITQNREKAPFTMQHPALEKAYYTVIANIEKHEGAAPSPAAIGARLCKIVAAKHPAHRYLIGQTGQTIVPLLKQILPGRWFDKLMNDYYGIA